MALSPISWIYFQTRMALSLPAQREERDATREDQETGALSPRRRKMSNAAMGAIATRRNSSASKLVTPAPQQTTPNPEVSRLYST